MGSAAQYRQIIHSALRQYVDMGLPVIPLCAHDHSGSSQKHIDRCACAGKTPLIRGWVDHTTTTKDQMLSWIKEFSTFNLGLPLGHTSGYIGIDVDGLAGEDMLDELSGGDLPDTWSFRTGDGFRLLYEIPIGVITKKFVNQDMSQEHTECSILAYGQQTAMPPSVHHTGREYSWDEGHSPQDMDCAMAPDWLLDLVRDTTGKKNNAGTIDLTSANPTYTKPETEKQDELIIHPLLVSDETVGSEFIDYVDIPLDLRAPDPDYTGKAGKGQSKSEDKGLTADDMTQILSQGGRDVGMTRIIGHFCAKFRDLGKDYIMVLAKNHNSLYCQPPLDDVSVETKVNHIWEKEEVKSAEYKKKRSEEGRVEFEPPTVAQVALNLLESAGYILKAAVKEPVIWMTKKSEGPWIPYYLGGNAEEFQPYLAQALTSEEYGGFLKWGTRKNFGEVASSLLLNLRMSHRVWSVDGFDTNTQSLKGHEYIPLKGGKLLEWKTGKLLPWDPESHLTYVLPIEYDPTAKAPNWEKRLAQWLPDEDTRKVVQEYMGYSFIPYMGFEKAMLIQGEGANGKSMFLETLQLMLGKEITASATMSFLFSRFGKRPLIGKILNIVNEAGADYLRGSNADDFKNMVSGGAVTADVKNKEPIVFNNTAKFIFSANHDIKTSDKSAAWGRRIILVPFDQDFRGSTETKSDIMDELTTEFSGIFNWALQGLQRLMENKRFTESQVISKRMDEYLTRNDISSDFYANCLRKRPELAVDGEIVERGVAASSVTDLFKLWCSYRGTELKKHNERIKDHLDKLKFKSARKTTKYLTMSDAAKTSCWVNLEIHVTDPEFLEYVCEEELLAMSNIPLKTYISKRLEELNQEPTPPKPPATNIPASEAK